MKEDENGLLEVVITKEGYVKTRCNSFEGLDEKELRLLRDILDGYIKDVDALGKEKGADLSSTKPIVSLTHDDAGVRVFTDNGAIKKLPPMGLLGLINGLANAMSNIQELTTVSGLGENFKKSAKNDVN